MRGIRSLLAAVLLAGVPFPSMAGATALPQRPAVVRGESPVDRLVRWVLELERDRSVLDPARLADAQWMLADIGLAWEARVGDPKEVAKPVLDLCGHLLAREHEGLGGGVGSQAERLLLATSLELLTGRLADIREWLGREVLPLSSAHPVERRAAAARALGADDSLVARLALFTGTRDESVFLRDEAVLGLVGRQEESVHKVLLDLLMEAEAGRLELRRGPIERHFRELRLDPEAPTHARVLAYVRARIAGESWRLAARAVAVSRCLAPEVVPPMLIEALAVWMTRAAGGVPSRRIQGELLKELERRSGRRLGLNPERWRNWWRAVQAGEISLEGHVPGTPSFSQAGFFGLRPMTDRVTFVLDRSGSMEAAFGSYSGSNGRPGRTRLREAAAQLGTCLEQLGPATLFDVVVFSEGARVWRGRLAPASPANIAAATGWVLSNGTGGGTHLRAGFEAAMHLDAGGRVQLAELEADTIIVLCDGETADGPDWVRPTLRRVNDEARVLFHAVRIGGKGDGTLRALCDETGGDFVQVDG